MLISKYNQLLSAGDSVCFSSAFCHVSLDLTGPGPDTFSEGEKTQVS